MKKGLKKTLKWTGITLLLFIVILILIPIFFKDQLKQMVVDEVNKNLTAELKVGDFDLTFFSTFPNMTVQLHDTKLIGKGKFKGVELMAMKQLTAHVGFWSVVTGDQVEIDEIHVEELAVDVRILEDGTANYDIVKPDDQKTPEELEEPSKFKLSLQEYSITKGKIRYDDRMSKMFMELHDLEHSGKGDLTAETFDFETITKISKCTYRMGGVDYLTEVKTDADVKMYMEFTEKSSKFTLKDNTIKLNALTCSLNGYYEMFDGYDEMDLKIDASKTSFKDFLSLIPAFYRTGYESMIGSGSLSLTGLVKGKMDDKNLPAWDFGLKVNDGSVKYTGLPGKISNIQIDAGSDFPGGADMNKMTVDVPKFHANFGKNTIDANLFLSNLEVDPRIKSKINTHIDLSTLKQFLPMTEGESYNGILDANVDLAGVMSSIEKEQYDKFKAEGVMDLSKFNYASKEMTEDVKIDHMRLTFSPQKLILDELDAKMGKSDFRMEGSVDEYFEYFFKENGNLVGTMSFSSDFLDLDELMNVYPEETTETTAKTEDPMEETGPTLVPANIDFDMATSIKKAKYNGITVRDISGKTGIKREVATLKDFSMKAMGGTVGLNGNYNTVDHANPKFDFDYSLQDIDIQQLTANFLTVGKLAPLAKFAKGRISSSFAMDSKLDNNLMPILNSITSKGDVRSNSISISGIPLLEKIESITRLKDLSSQSLKNFQTRFSISDGKVILKPFNVNLGKIPTVISGYTTLDKEMDYKFAMDIPKEQIPASLLKEVEKGLTLLNGLHPKLSLGDLPASIKANVYAKGDPKNPKITTDLPEMVKAAVKDKMGNLLDDIKTTAIDSAKAIVNDVKTDVKAEIEAKKKKILADAQKRADQIKAEGKNAANKVRAEAKTQGDKLIAEAGSNPVKKKLAEAAAKKLADEAEKKAQAIESEANKKADEVMRKAHEEANKLG